MLLESKQYKKAQDEYEASLKRNKNRFNSLYGAGRTAEMQGDVTSAKYYYEVLIGQTRDADTENERINHAKMYLRNNK